MKQTTKLNGLQLTDLLAERNYILIALVLFLLLWRIPYYGKFVLDDPFITFRYAQNLIAHGQFTYNLDEYILATTTPVYGLIMAVFEGLRLPVPIAAMLFNLTMEIALLIILGQILSEIPIAHWQQGLAYAVAGLLTISNRAVSIASNSGMETPLFLLLNYATLLFVIRQRYRTGAIYGSLATLTRPDGVFVLLLLGAIVLVRDRRLPLMEMGLSLLIGMPWVLIATLTYGAPIPQSVIAKNAIIGLWPTNLLFNNLRVVFYEPLRFFGIFAAPFIVWHLYQSLVSRRSWADGILLTFGLIHLGYLALPNNLGFDWYFAPLYIFLNLFIGIGLASMIAAQKTRQVAASVCAVGLLLGVGYSSTGNYRSVAQIDRIWRNGMFQMIDYLNTHAAKDSLVQCTNIGILGYYTGLRILDPLGLASKETTKLMDNASSLNDLLRSTAAALKPDYIVSFGQEEYADYEVAATFTTEVEALILYRRL